MRIAFFTTLLTICLVFHVRVHAGPIRISLLSDPGALVDTVQVLTNAGCPKAAVAMFERIVRRYHAEPFDFDFGKFPRPTNGFYSFPSPQGLVMALPHRLPETRHTFDVNCVDTLILLSEGGLATRLRPDDIVGPIMVSVPTTNGEAVAFAATPRDAFALCAASWYREATDFLFPGPTRDRRICLTASLFRWHLLPMSTSREDLGRQVLDVLRAMWQRQAIQSPSDFEVVLLHNVDFDSHTICTCHGGLLLHRGSGFTYIEKAGGTGPFVRLDVERTPDLLPWLATAFKDYTHPNLRRFATFNLNAIEELRPQ